MTHDEWLIFLDTLAEHEHDMVIHIAARFSTVGAEYFADLLEEVRELKQRVAELEQLIGTTREVGH